jgi:FtsH-binding integral membrane protein
MTPNRSKRPYWPIILVYVISNAIIITGKRWSANLKVDTNVLIIGNTVLLVATLVSFFLYQRSLQNNRAQAFLRYIYSGMFLKMLICLFAALIYIFVSDGNVNKPALFGCMFLYFVYTFMEVSILLRLSKQQQNVQTGSPA